MNVLRAFLAAGWRDGVFQRALLVAILVGTVLNLINQGDRLAKGQAIDGAKALLTYMVPFLVSAHGALSARRAGKVHSADL